MTDLVFLLLIFFIILSALAKNTVDGVNLPQGGGPTEPNTSEAIIAVRPDNTIWLNEKEITLEKLGYALEKAVENDEKRVVEFYGDKASDFGIAVEIISIVKERKMKIAIMADK